jgi:ABC-type multidrug transport system ATPase subunit
VYKQRSDKSCKQQLLAAVSDLSFGVEQGECFALLGVNGAGKSTTFKSLTCEVKPTSGKIKIGGYNI